MSSHPKRLLFVVTKGRLSPASHKRVYDMLPLLHSLGYETDVQEYEWELLWKIRMRSDEGRLPYRKLIRALNASRSMPLLLRARNGLARRRFAALVEKSDAVVVNQSFLEPRWRDILRRARHVIYEFDDAVWLADDALAADMIGAAHTVVTGNGFLAEYARRLHSHVRVIPTGVRIDRYESAPAVPRKRAAACTVGWVGSPASARYLELLVEPLAEVGSATPITLEIVGSSNARLPAFRNVEVRLFPKVPYDPVDYVPRFDIGVMPLFNGDLERGKCGAKALEYMAAGVPAVCSRVGENRQIVADGVTGFLASTAEEWVSVLSALARDPDLRRRVGAAGREHVRGHYSAQVVAALWDDCLRERLGV